MSIGGDDVVLLAPARECIADAILRACGRHWAGAECQFQDARETAAHAFSEPWVWTEGTNSREFSVYRDAQAFRSWREHGGSAANANTMFHFIIGDRAPEDERFVEVAMVFDKWTPAVRVLIDRLRAAFLSLMTQARRPEAA